MNRKTKAKIFFVVGCLIVAASPIQIIAALNSKTPFMAVIGAVCLMVSYSCCRTNWDIWHPRS